MSRLRWRHFVVSGVVVAGGRGTSLSILSKCHGFGESLAGIHKPYVTAASNSDFAVIRSCRCLTRHAFVVLLCFHWFCSSSPSTACSQEAWLVCINHMSRLRRRLFVSVGVVAVGEARFLRAGKSRVPTWPKYIIRVLWQWRRLCAWHSATTAIARSEPRRCHLPVSKLCLPGRRGM